MDMFSGMGLSGLALSSSAETRSISAARAVSLAHPRPNSLPRRFAGDHSDARLVAKLDVPAACRHDQLGRLLVSARAAYAVPGARAHPAALD
jgi:hypothetical protein